MVEISLVADVRQSTIGGPPEGALHDDWGDLCSDGSFDSRINAFVARGGGVQRGQCGDRGGGS